MSRNVKSILTLLLVLLLIVGVSVIPLPAEFDSDLSATRNQVQAVGENAN